MVPMFRAGSIVWLAGSVVVAPVAAQTPPVTGVVVVRAANAAETADALVGLGFVAGEAQVIASVDADITSFVVTDVGGTEHEGRLVAADEGLGLGLLAVPGLTTPPYPFASVSAQAPQAVHAATRDATSGTVALVSGRVLTVEAGAATSDPEFVRHDAFNDWQRNFGAPLLNICGEIIGAVVDDRDPNLASSGSDRAVPGAWLLARFSAVGLAATTADRPCRSDAERAAAAEAAAAEAERRAAAEAERRRRAEAAANAEADLREQAESTAEAAQVDAAEAVEARRLAEQESAEAQQQAAADRARYLRWAGVGAVGVVTAGLLFWLAGRRSVTKARKEQVTAETLAQAAHEDLAERAAQDRLASAVPAVLLDGADAQGRPIAVRIPGSAIADAGGAVVGRNPFESALVLDHTEVSRRHFRLFARETTVFVEDVHSTNGTMLDDVRLTPGAPVAIRHGGVLQVGDLTLTVTLDAAGAGRLGDNA